MNTKVISSIFSEVCKINKNKIAVRTDKTALNYFQIDVLSYRIAKHIYDEIGKSQIIATVLPTSIEYILAILGINKSGNAFLPIDITHPIQKISEQINFAEPAIVIANRQTINLVEEINPNALVFLIEIVNEDIIFSKKIDEKWKVLENDLKSISYLLDIVVDEKSNAYVLYTSGTTGIPKAILGRNDSLCHFIEWQISHFRLEGIRSGMLTSVGFDVSLRDIFTPLLAGGELVIPNSHQKENMHSLLAWIDEAKIELLHIVPSIFRLLVINSSVSKLVSLKNIFLAGEPLYWGDLLKWKEQDLGPHARFVNLYGPSETTLAKFFYEVPVSIPSDVQGNEIVPIGIPLPDTKVFVSSLNGVCEEGETGEIIIYTKYPSNGYFKNPALNRENFVMQKNDDGIESLCYKTGDLGYIQNGILKFIGRKDRQVKIAGNRVELSEIESVFLKLKEINNVVIFVDDIDKENLTIVAFYTAANELNKIQISSFIEKYLPNYMKPNYIYFLELLPLNVNGKVNQNILADLHREQMLKRQKTENNAVENTVIAKLITIIQKATKINVVETDRTLMEIGASSLKAIQIISEIYKEFKVKLSIPFVLSNNIHKVAAFIDEEYNNPDVESQDKFVEKNYYRVTPSQEQMLFISEYSKSSNLAYNVSLVYKIEGVIDIDKINGFFNAILQKYEILRTSYIIIDDTYQQKINPINDKNPVVKKIVAEEEVELYLSNEISQEFDLKNDTSLLKVILLEVNEKESYLIFNTHHITIDVWSLQIIERDFFSYYLTGQLYDTSTPYIPYSHFSELYNKTILDDGSSKSRGYWQKMFKDKSSFEFPTDFVRPKQRNFVGNIETLELSDKVGALIFNYIQSNNMTLYMFYISVLSIMLKKYAGTDPVLGSPVSLRNMGTTFNQTIGYFLNMMPMKLSVQDNISFEEHAQNLKSHILEMYEHKYYPFSYIVDDLEYKYPLDRNPLFNHMVVEIEEIVEGIESADITSSSSKMPEFTFVKGNDYSSKFDITFFIVKKDNGLRLAIEYDVMLYKKETIQFLLKQLDNLICEVIEMPSKPIGDYSLASYKFGVNKEELVNNIPTQRKKILQTEEIINEEINLYVLPRTEEEIEMSNIWKKILKTDRDISIYQEFFSLGGNSLKALLLISEINKVYQKSLTLIDLFEASTIEKLSALQSKSKDVAYVNIEPIKIQDYYELSSSQQRLWVIDQIGISKTAYNINGIYHFEDDIDLDIFKHSIEKLVERHESLRTIFVKINDTPKQQIINSAKLNVDVELLNISEKNNTHISMDVIQDKIFNHEYKLDVWPLFKLLVIKKDGKCKLLYSMHHIISDAWSIELLIRDILAIYESILKVIPLTLPDLKIQYKDYANWQNNLILNSQGEYWMSKLSGALPYIRLPHDYEGGNVSTDDNVSYYDLHISELLKSRIEDFLIDRKTSLFALFIACFKIVLNRLTAESDIVVGIPVANRVDENIKDLIGFFINTLMLRDSLDKNSDFDSFLDQVNHTLIEGLENQSYPFEEVLENLGINRDFNHFPISSIFLNMINIHSTEEVFVGDKNPKHGKFQNIAKFDLECYFKEYKNTILLSCVYKNNLFKPETISYWMNEYVSAIQQVVNDPLLIIKDIKIFEKPKSKILISKLHDTFEYFDNESINQSIVTRFEESVKKYPHNTAIYDDDKSISYIELNSLSNGLAEKILSYKNCSESNIALLLDHSSSAIVSMLGVLKSGNVYVPLDPYYPVDRLKYIIEDINCKLIIAADETIELAEAIAKYQKDILIINISRDIIHRQTNLEISIDPESQGYILYTSGSTGRPKGVIQSHKNILHFMRVYTNNLHINANDKLSLLPTYSFDSSVMDIYGALLNGASLSIYNIKQKGIDGLAKWLHNNRISIFHTVPTIYRYFISGLNVDVFETIRLVVLGGEAVFKNDFENFKRHFTKNSIFINGYGPTESTITVQKFLNHESEVTTRNIPIGFPVQDTKVYILDENDEEMGVYGVGEIVYRSEYLALGYLNNKSHTDSVFTVDPVIKKGKVYRSGDLGKILPSGEIEFIGRKDNQVKLNGQRLELSEIEHNLLNISGIEEAIVVLKVLEKQNQLVAYIKSQKQIDTYTIKQKLNENLPLYMVPAIYIFIDKFPLTSTGKISRLALPEPKLSEIKSTEYLAPKNEIEQKLVLIWEEVLGRTKIGTEDNFFELGGNSLIAFRMLSKIRNEFNINFEMKELFNGPSILFLAKEIKRKRWASQNVDAADEIIITI